MVLNYIDFDRVERKICCFSVDELQGGVKSEILKKLGDSTVYGTDKLE